jgi:hypothetical protein
MGRLSLAFRAFFGTLFTGEVAERVASIFDNTTSPKSIETRQPEPVPVPKPSPTRSEALTLLEALQREARLLDLCQESLENYTDAQVGAAARNVLRDTSQLLRRYFALEPLSKEPEGTTTVVPPGFDPAQFRLSGSATGNPPFSGRIVHTGWRATRCELPRWSGQPEASFILAPVEVEVG